MIARYPSQPDAILQSGFLQGAGKLAGKVAAADSGMPTHGITIDQASTHRSR